MADNSVNDLLDLINQQIDCQENLGEYLSKADALSLAALNKNFQECSEETQHYYLWAMNDLISNAKMMNEGSIKFLFNCKKSNSETNFDKPDEKS